MLADISPSRAMRCAPYGTRAASRPEWRGDQPSRLENFFQERPGLLTSGAPNMAGIAALAANYGLQFGEPPWLSDIVSRYGLTTPI